MSAERKARVSDDVVLPALFAGRKAGKKMAEIAEGIGMNPTSFAQRVSSLKKRFKTDAAAKSAKGESVVNPFDTLAKGARKSAGNVFDRNAELLATLAAIDTPVTE